MATYITEYAKRKNNVPITLQPTTIFHSKIKLIPYTKPANKPITTPKDAITPNVAL